MQQYQHETHAFLCQPTGRGSGLSGLPITHAGKEGQVVTGVKKYRTIETRGSFQCEISPRSNINIKPILARTRSARACTKKATLLQKANSNS